MRNYFRLIKEKIEEYYGIGIQDTEDKVQRALRDHKLDLDTLRDLDLSIPISEKEKFITELQSSEYAIRELNRLQNTTL